MSDRSSSVAGGPANLPNDMPGTSDWWQRRYQRDGRRRPRADGLTIQRITTAALGIIDHEGLDALTMRRLADDLGTGAASLYRHVANRDELLVEIVDQVLGEVCPPPPSPTWRDGAEWLARDLHRVLSQHEAVIQLLPGDPLLGPNALRGRELGLRFLLDHGFGEAEAVHVYAVVVSWILGYFLLSRGMRQHAAPRSAAYGAVPATEYPTVRYLAPLGPPGDDVLFDLGLVTLLDGIEARYRR